jgi:thioesterase domain-containing protein
MIELATLDRHFDSMPPVAAMRIRAAGMDADSLWLHAPLQANVNDKSCAFGGSLASIMTLAGWGWLTLAADRAGLTSEVYVADSSIRYLAPLFEDLRGHAWLRPDQDWAAIVRTLGERRRTSATMLAEIRSETGAVAATMEARYALRIAPHPLAVGTDA